MSKIILSKYDKTIAKTRNERFKKIKRKKYITEHIYGWVGYYKHEGRYSKNKIHCSCYCCRNKGNNKKEEKHSNKIKLDIMKAKENEYTKI